MTSPATLAGSLAQTLAEELGTITLIQSARPGPSLRLLRRSGAWATCATARRSPERPSRPSCSPRSASSGTELFGVPTSAIGLDTDGFSGAQTMFQKAQNVAFQVLAGGTVVVGAGRVETIMALSPAQLVIDDEFLAIADRWRQGIRVTEETLAVDVVKRVGPRGSYLADEHTLDALHAGELLDLTLAERESRRAVWESRGRRTLESRAADRARELLATHEVPPLPDEVLRELAALEAAADRELSGEQPAPAAIA